jgi:hypothetical protein
MSSPSKLFLKKIKTRLGLRLREAKKVTSATSPPQKYQFLREQDELLQNIN